MLKELMLKEERKGKECEKYFLNMVYVGLLLIIISVPYLLRDWFSSPWSFWSILGACILIILWRKESSNISEKK